jgi:hypothetical protein
VKPGRARVLVAVGIDGSGFFIVAFRSGTSSGALPLETRMAARISRRARSMWSIPPVSLVRGVGRLQVIPRDLEFLLGGERSPRDART